MKDSIRCGACRKKLAETRGFQRGEITVKCPRCGAYTTKQADSAPAEAA